MGNTIKQNYKTKKHKKQKHKQKKTTQHDKTKLGGGAPHKHILFFLFF